MKNYQHQPLRKPEGWTGQDAALVIQLERQLDDIYRKLGALKEKIGDVESNSLTISEQELTSTEQSRVRNNIGAASASGLSSLSEQIGTINSKLATSTGTLSSSNFELSSGTSRYTTALTNASGTWNRTGNVVSVYIGFKISTASSSSEYILDMSNLLPFNSTNRVQIFGNDNVTNFYKGYIRENSKRILLYLGNQSGTYASANTTFDFSATYITAE